MRINKQKLLLALYRLEEGQQAILQRLERPESKDPPACGLGMTGVSRNDAAPFCEGGHPAETAELNASPARGDGGRMADGGVDTADRWIIDGIEAILSYRSHPKEERE